AVTMRALPVILPVNFCMLDGDVVLRSGPGTKLDAALANAVVAFEVDSFASMEHTGWSVMVQGVASQITDPREQARAAQLPLRPWSGEGRKRYVRIRTHEITGRRLAHRYPAA